MDLNRLFAARHARCGAGSLFHNWAVRRVVRRLQLDPEQEGELLALAAELAVSRAHLAGVRRDGLQLLSDQLDAPQLDREGLQRLFTLPEIAWRERSVPLAEAFGRFCESLEPQQRSRLGAWLRRHR